MQMLIGAVTLFVLLTTRQWLVATGFLLAMELFSVYGALWGDRIRRFRETGRFVL
jgi:hypothetical protein